jgi:hypothetical protein
MFLFPVQGLVALACEKLSVDIPIVIQDDVLLAHTIDETIGNYRDFNHDRILASLAGETLRAVPTPCLSSPFPCFPILGFALSHFLIPPSVLAAMIMD